MRDIEKKFAKSLWQIYRRPERPALWVGGGNLPWNEPDFSRRMLAEHLDESHGAASRQTAERLALIDWLWERLGLKAGAHLLDVTCGPGLYAVEFAAKGCIVTGIDFSPASIAYARELAAQRGVADRCTFIEQDVREAKLPEAAYDAALFLYGQLGVFPKNEARILLERIRRSLVRPAGNCASSCLIRTRSTRATAPGGTLTTRAFGRHPVPSPGRTLLDRGRKDVG